MKRMFQKMGRMGRMGLMAIALAFLVVPPMAQAQVQPTDVTGALSNTVACITVSSNVVNAVEIDVWQGKGMSFSVNSCGTQSTNTGLMAYFFKVTQDGSNYTTTTPLIIYETGTGTTSVRGWTNVPATALDNVRKVKLYQITNALGNMATNYVTNVYVGRKY